jgi:hypothetical protein
LGVPDAPQLNGWTQLSGHVPLQPSGPPHFPVQFGVQSQTLATPPPPQVLGAMQVFGQLPRQPSGPPHLPAQFGTQQTAPGCEPLQPSAHEDVVATTQPSALVPQLARTEEDWQKAPLACPAQPAGGAGQVQAAFGAVPAQGRPAGQVTIVLMARHPVASSAQVTRVLPWHAVPAPAAQAAGGGGQEQLAAGWLPLQGLPPGQVVRAGATVTHPRLSIVQVATVVADSQKVPAPAAHTVGRSGH